MMLNWQEVLDVRWPYFSWLKVHFEAFYAIAARLRDALQTPLLMQVNYCYSAYIEAAKSGILVANFAKKYIIQLQ